MGNYNIYSDGGGNTDTAGACGCIVEDDETRQRIHIAGFLGGATNNECEISGGMLAFVLLRHLLLRKVNGGMVEKVTANTLSRYTGTPLSSTTVTWFADSEYVLKSATQYILKWKNNGWLTASKEAVKNQNYWRLYLLLSTGLKIVPNHVYGHTGHPENELCDAISTRLRHHGKKVFQTRKLVAKVAFQGVSWWCVDMRPFVEILRRDKEHVNIEQFTVDLANTLAEICGVEISSVQPDGGGYTLAGDFSAPVQIPEDLAPLPYGTKSQQRLFAGLAEQTSDSEAVNGAVGTDIKKSTRRNSRRAGETSMSKLVRTLKVVLHEVDQLRGNGLGMVDGDGMQLNSPANNTSAICSQAVLLQELEQSVQRFLAKIPKDS